MGCQRSKTQDEFKRKPGAQLHLSHITDMQEEIEMQMAIPIEIAVAHFTPSNFPLLPVVTRNTAILCAESWEKIMKNGAYNEEEQYSSSGIAGFYNEFYERLDVFDSGGKFDAVLSRHSSGANKSEAKGAILVRIIKFVLKIAEDNKQTQTILYMLGKSHAQKSIRPWQYSVFVQTLLITIASRLQTAATNDVMGAWVNLFAFVMRSMLPPAIKGQIVETELNINTSSEFAAGKIADEVAEIEEVKELKRKFGSQSERGKQSSRNSEVSASARFTGPLGSQRDSVSKASETSGWVMTNGRHPSSTA